MREEAQTMRSNRAPQNVELSRGIGSGILWDLMTCDTNRKGMFEAHICVIRFQEFLSAKEGSWDIDMLLYYFIMSRLGLAGNGRVTRRVSNVTIVSKCPHI